MRIVLLLNSAARMGGVEHVARDLAAGFVGAGHPARLLGLWGRSDDEPLLLPGYVTALARWSTASRHLDPASAVAHRDRFAQHLAARRLRRLVPDEPDVALVATSALTARVLALSGYRDAVTVAQHHGSLEALTAGRDLAMLKEAGDRLDGLLVLSLADVGRLQAMSPGVDVEAIRNPTVVPATIPEVEARPRTVVALGRFEPPKDFPLLLRAWAQIEEQATGWRLEIYGSGSQSGLLRSLVSTLGISGSVTLHPPSAEPLNVLSRASLLALASRSEGMPLVILEAFAVGTPVVASACSAGVAELVTPQSTGWLVPPDDDSAFSAALLDAMTDDQGRLRAARAARAEAARFDVTAVVDDWLKLFGRISQDRRR